MTAFPPISAAGGWRLRNEHDVFNPIPPDLQATDKSKLLHGAVTQAVPDVTLDENNK